MKLIHGLIGSLLLATVAQAAGTHRQASISLEGAQQVMAAALRHARTHKAPGAAIAVVDAGGNTVLVTRLDDTFAAGADISVGKARTAVLFKRPTRLIEETINKGRTAMTTLPGVTTFTPLQGGLPIVVEGAVVGGIGVSGASSAQQDEEIALAGVEAFKGNPAADAIHIPASDFRTALQRQDTGDTLLATPQFRVNVSRRDAPGQAEIHRHDTDIFFVLTGEADVVTGGELAEPREVAPGEIRGFALRGGIARRLRSGDVLTIPAGMPHWFQSVSPPFEYFVVKATTSP